MSRRLVSDAIATLRLDYPHLEDLP
jgi:hypothetical protein